MNYMNVARDLKTGVYKRQFFRYVKKNYWFYFFLIPGIAYFILFHYVPMYGILLAFKNYNFRLGIVSSPWAGFEHFKMAFSTSGFWRAFTNSLIISMYKLIWGFPAPIILALLLNEIRHIAYKKVVQNNSVSASFHFVGSFCRNDKAFSITFGRDD